MLQIGGASGAEDEATLILSWAGPIASAESSSSLDGGGGASSGSSALPEASGLALPSLADLSAPGFGCVDCDSAAGCGVASAAAGFSGGESVLALSFSAACWSMASIRTASFDWAAEALSTVLSPALTAAAGSAAPDMMAGRRNKVFGFGSVARRWTVDRTGTRKKQRQKGGDEELNSFEGLSRGEEDGQEDPDNSNRKSGRRLDARFK